jgi:hypothetical protein
MARLTVEDCLAHESNRFALVLLAADTDRYSRADSKRRAAGGAKPV